MKFLMKVVLAAALISLPAFAGAAQSEVPAVWGYHAEIYDEGGNAIQDGDWDVQFRITDTAGEPLYEESQTLSAIGGQISALIGNGLTADGAPTGGVPIEALDPNGSRYLEVLINDMEPLPVTELASVPYADYAQIALGAADSSITYDMLADSTADEIAKELTGGEGKEAIVLMEELDTIYSDPSSAVYIGVATGDINNSSSDDLQNVLDDLDGAIDSNAGSIVVNSQDIATCEDKKVSRDGDTINGTITINGDVIVQDGNRVDGYDISEEIEALDQRTVNLESALDRDIWGSVIGGISPSINGSNVSMTSPNVDNYYITFSFALSDPNYAVVLTPIAGVVESPVLPKIYGKTTTGFTVHFDGASTRNFDFIVMGNY